MSNFEMIGATHVGKKHVENQDRIVRRELCVEDTGHPICLIAVVDGVSASPLAASIARWITEKHLERDVVVNPSRGALSEQVNAYLSSLHQQFRADFEDFEEMLTSAASLSLAVIEETAAHIFWAGDSPIYLTECRDEEFKTSRISTPHVSPKGRLAKCFCGDSLLEVDYREVSIQPGDIVTISSDGAVHEETMLNELYQREGFGEPVCDEVIEIGLREQFADDVSIVACRCAA